MMTILDQAELVEQLSQIKGEVSATLMSKTVFKLNKKDVATKSIANPFGTIYKIQMMDVELNTQYEEEVNARRMVEGNAQDFEAGALKWGKAINNIVIEKDGNMYVKTVVIGKIGDSTYIDENGNTVQFADFAQFVPPYSGSAKQAVTDEVKVRTFKISSISRLVVADNFRYLAAI